MITTAFQKNAFQNNAFQIILDVTRRIDKLDRNLTGRIRASSLRVITIKPVKNRMV